MRAAYLSHLSTTVDQIKAEGFYKAERVIASPQAARIELDSGASFSTSVPITISV